MTERRNRWLDTDGGVRRSALDVSSLSILLHTGTELPGGQLPVQTGESRNSSGLEIQVLMRHLFNTYFLGAGSGSGTVLFTGDAEADEKGKGLPSVGLQVDKFARYEYLGDK